MLGATLYLWGTRQGERKRHRKQKPPHAKAPQTKATTRSGLPFAVRVGVPVCIHHLSNMHLLRLCLVQPPQQAPQTKATTRKRHHKQKPPHVHAYPSQSESESVSAFITGATCTSCVFVLPSHRKRHHKQKPPHACIKGHTQDHARRYTTHTHKQQQQQQHSTQHSGCRPRTYTERNNHASCCYYRPHMSCLPWSQYHHCDQNHLTGCISHKPAVPVILYIPVHDFLHCYRLYIRWVHCGTLQ